MDIDYALLTLRSLLVTSDHAVSYADPIATLSEAAEALDVLDGWLSRGGYLPSAWSANR